MLGATEEWDPTEEWDRVWLEAPFPTLLPGFDASLQHKTKETSLWGNW